MKLTWPPISSQPVTFYANFPLAFTFVISNPRVMSSVLLPPSATRIICHLSSVTSPPENWFPSGTDFPRGTLFFLSDPCLS